MGPIKGNVRFLYMMDDEATWSNAYVIQDKNGKGYFVPLFNPPDVNLLFKNVSLSLKTSQSGKLTPVVKEINDPDMDKEFEKKIEKGRKVVRIHQERNVALLMCLRCCDNMIDSRRIKKLRLNYTDSRAQRCAL